MISQYDKIADKYDSLFLDKESLQENNEIKSMLSVCEGSVCDIGCGTGLLVELFNIKPQDYYGIDPSVLMLDKFVEKHPLFRYSLENSTFEDSHLSLNSFDNLISLFGSISYVQPEHLLRINNSAKHLFLMFYRPNYSPVTYSRTGVEFFHYKLTKGELREKFRNARIKEYRNYIIVSR